MAEAHSLAIAFTHDAIPEDLPLEIALCLYRVAQESVHNVIRHARATHAEVHLATAEGELRLMIADDGAGFDTEAPQAKSSLGFVSMKERVRLVDGRLKVESQPEKGTWVEVVVPRPKGA
jgi:signal transduction histidine kinase